MERSRGAPDFLLLFLTLSLVGFGIVMVFSASSILAYMSADYNHDSMYFVKKQALWAVIGFVAMLVVMNIPYQFYKKLFFPIMILSFILLLLVKVPGLGATINEARSWLKIGPYTLQTSELAKLGLIIYLAGLINKKRERFRVFSTGLLPAVVVTGGFFITIATQPDFGTASILLATAVIVIFAGGAHLKHIFYLSLPAILFSLYYIFDPRHPYRMDRITSYLNPWNDSLGSGFQLIHSYYAMGHGGLTGVGFGKSIQKFLYLPLPQTDFIFAVMAEELGFIGCTAFIIVFLLFLWRAVYISLKSRDVFAYLLGIGIVGMIAVQAVINIGGVTGTIPITGVPLPFISYGGSSLLTCMIGTGLILSISRQIDRTEDKEPARG
ncbi:MAG: putative lipid II flippase FtsW [Bacillaceae bacterium]|nr:putative lipid II flippase FtsW [Bacillaceae bacterium]